MYLRSKLQQRALYNLDLYTQTQVKYKGIRVTKGYVISDLLNNFHTYIKNTKVLRDAILESDIKQEGPSTAVNLNITSEANKKLEELKEILDKDTGRSLFPAQILDILLICALNKSMADTTLSKEVSDKELAKVMLEFAYKLLSEDVLPVKIANARQDIINAFVDNYLL